MHKFDFIVIGPAKTGTTSLHHLLKMDQRISLPHSKEVPIFDKKYQSELHEFFINNGIDSSKITGKITPQYFSNLNAISNIKKHNKKTKIIVILRDPVERLISHYIMLNSRGLTNESLDSLFKKYLNNSIDVNLKKIFLDSEYNYFLDNIYNEFQFDSVLVLNFDLVIKNDNHEIKRLYDFLSIDQKKILKFPKKNTQGFGFIKNLGDPLYWQRKSYLNKLYPFIKILFPKKYRKSISFYFKTFSSNSFLISRNRTIVGQEVKDYFKENSSKYYLY